MEPDEGVVSIPLIHEHPMMPWNDMRKGKCCRHFEPISDGYFCKKCDFFIHKKCGDEIPESIDHPFHPDHTLRLHHKKLDHECNICRRSIKNIFYRCEMCDFDVDLYCVKYPPPNVIDSSETHRHKLTIIKKHMWFDCDAKCGKYCDDEFSYKCHECDLTFHIDCIWHPAPGLNHSPEVNHSYHSLHPLKLFKGEPPYYSDGICRLCGREIDMKLFYHCSSCNFTLDMRCILHPPPQSLLDLRTHEHQLTLLPRLDSFTCNACGLKGDRSPYMCVQCDFVIHQDCLGLPRVININWHDHRIFRTFVLGAVNSVCGVCRQKVDWKWGGYFCRRCPGYVVHSKCATRKDVWNGKELHGIPEEKEDTESPYVLIDENTIHHFSHKEHYLRLHVNGDLSEDNKRCNACIDPVGLQSFYSCMNCDFTLHQSCAECSIKKWHVLHNNPLTLVTTKTNYFECNACRIASTGFMYKHEAREFDVLCGSISEPFIHPSHLHHPLYYIPSYESKNCNGCNSKIWHVLRCIENGCGFALDFGCATLPLVIKHRVDEHPLSLCYDEEEASDMCDICEKEINLKNWFYTNKNHLVSLHTECVLGEISFRRLMPRSTIKYSGFLFDVVLNNSMTRPLCWECNSRCIYPMVFKLLGTSDTYFCTIQCITYWIELDYHER